MSQQEALVALNIRDLLKAFHIEASLGVWKWFARFPAARFTKEVLDFDHIVGERGLVAGGEFILERFTGSVTLCGAEHIPRTGAVVVTSNHPGMMDAMAVWRAIQREDLRIIAAERDLLKLLPNISRYLIFVKPGSLRVFQEAEEHLRSGGAILTFPAGHIEPDLAIRSGALDSLGGWSRSMEVLARRVPKLPFVPAFVQGAISADAVRNPVLRYLRTQKDKEWAGATLQILCPWYRNVALRVDFGNPTEKYDEVLAQMHKMVQKYEAAAYPKE